MNFNDLKYERPNYEEYQKKIHRLAEQMQAAEDEIVFYRMLAEYEELERTISTMETLAFARCYMDCTDTYYAEEMSYTQAQHAAIDKNEIAEAMLHTPFRKSLEEKYGSYLLESIEKKASLKQAGGDDLMREQELIAEYQNLKAGMTYEFRGEKLSAGKLETFLRSADPETRREAGRARRSAFVQLKDQYDRILQKLIEVRVRIAKSNGYDSFLDYMNVEKGRYAYGEKELTAFCDAVKKMLVPLCGQINARLKERLQVSKYTMDDVGIYFTEGNPTPQGDDAFLQAQGQKMFEDMDPQMAQIFRRMTEGGYMQIAPSDHKITGMAFTTQIMNEQIPFIFGNCVGTSTDVNNFVHEFGHAIQMQLSMDRFDMTELYDMPNDLAEIPSKTMEQMTYHYADLFFGEKSAQYKEAHALNLIHNFCAYCMTHEYETFLYLNPEATAQERIDKFNELEMLYFPGVESVDEDLLSQGCSLYANMGVYMFTRYLISYSLSDISALYLSSIYTEDKEKGVALYKKLCSFGNSMGYDEAMRELGLEPAYSEAAVRAARDYLEKQLSL